MLQHFALTMELQQLLTAKEYEKAFALTLGKADAQLLAWLLKKLEPRALFAATTLPQVVLATLATQLVADDLKEDAELKLAWIPEHVGHLQPRDPLVGPKLKGVVGAVQAKLDAKAAAFAGGKLRPYATAAAVVNYLLSISGDGGSPFDLSICSFAGRWCFMPEHRVVSSPQFFSASPGAMGALRAGRSAAPQACGDDRLGQRE